MAESCPAFWLENPHILVTQATEFFPFTEHDKRCTSAALNSFTRFGIYLGAVLAFVRMELSWLLIGVVFAVFTVVAWYVMRSNGAMREGFMDTEAPVIDGADVQEKYVPDIIGSQGRTMPTAANPFMNVLLTEISDNPYRTPAASAEGVAVKSELDGYFDTMFAADPGDVFQKSQSQRQWYTTPSTTIPNDVESLQNWLYRTPGQTCKEGNMGVCNPTTGPEEYPWRQIRKLT